MRNLRQKLTVSDQSDLDILFTISTLQNGGAERVVSRLSSTLAREFKVAAAVFDTSAQAFPFSGEILSLNARAKPFFLAKIANLILRSAKLAILIKRRRPQAIFSFMESANFAACVAAIVTGSCNKLVVSIHSNPASFSFWTRLSMRLLYRFPAKIAACSRAIERQLVEDLGLPREKCITIPNGIDLLEVKELVNAIVPRIPPKPYIVTVGRLSPEKGFDLLIETMKIIFDRGISIDLLIVGEGSERRRLEHLVNELGIDGKVNLIGEVRNPFPYMYNAQAFVLTSRTEGWPNVLIEAMGAACPVIAFDCPTGPNEIIEDGKSGVLVPHLDCQQMATTLIAVLADEERRKQLSLGARNRVELFDLDIIARKWLKACSLA